MSTCCIVRGGTPQFRVVLNLVGPHSSLSLMSMILLIGHSISPRASFLVYKSRKITLHNTILFLSLSLDKAGD